MSNNPPPIELLNETGGDGLIRATGEFAAFYLTHGGLFSDYWTLRLSFNSGKVQSQKQWNGTHWAVDMAPYPSEKFVWFTNDNLYVQSQ